MPEQNIKALRVLYLAAEASPLVKIGGLGDVAGELPLALQNLPSALTDNHVLDVRLVLPFHAAIRKVLPSPRKVAEFTVPYPAGPLVCTAYVTNEDVVTTYLLSGGLIPENAPVYSPDMAQDARKYVFFSLAALELCRAIQWQPDILHANDWHTAAAVYALKLRKPRDNFFKDTRSVLTIHNLPFMGAGAETAMQEAGLPPSKDSRLPDWGKQFPLVVGMLVADKIVAVSPTYAAEILTPEFGVSLDPFLKTRADAITGILNGLDYSAWDPASDGAIPNSYTPETLNTRRKNKLELLNEFNLEPVLKDPLIIFIGRMDLQKGVDLVIQALQKCVDLNWQVILLGTGDPGLEDMCRLLESDLPDRARTAIRFDARLSRRLYAGADILLMPSRYEPCGLSQMIAMRYGCIPIARATGGLRDTIQDESSPNGGTGFLFEPADSAALAETLHRAIHVFRKPKIWRQIQLNAMQQNFAWDRSAQAYANLYLTLQKGSE